MLKKLMFAVLLVLLVSQFAVPAVMAEVSPAGSCAPGFTLHMAMDHDNHHHKHVGTAADLNADGYVCVKPVTPDRKIHVHVDNDLP